MTSDVNPPDVSLTFVQGLALVEVNGGQTIIISTHDPTTIGASAFAGNGAPSPAALRYSWTIIGEGWSTLGGTTGSEVTIEAAVGADPGLLSVDVNGSYRGSTVPSINASEDAVGISTTITNIAI
ncbi:MAG: hypothetical protein WCA77_08185, partial [Thermoplasmata archaeon]